jgi:hypothetical protein
MGVIGYYFSHFPMFLADYSVGLLSWLAGLTIAWYLKPSTTTHFAFLSYACLLICYNHFDIGGILLKTLHLSTDLEHGFGLEVLFNLPLCVLTVSDIAKRSLPCRRAIIAFVYALPALLILYLIYSGRILQDTRWIVSSICYGLAVLLMGERKLSTLLLKKLSFTGSISYAIYIFHFPIALLVGKYFPFSGSPVAYWIKFLVWIVLTFLFAYIGERILQPAISKFFIARRPAVATPVAIGAERNRV